MAIPEKVSRWRYLVDKWCMQLQISQALVLAVIQMESGGDPDAKRHEPAFENRYVRGNAKWEKVGKELGMTPAALATSYGLMQMMFTTAYGYGCKSVAQALDPDQAIRFGAAHLAMLCKKYDVPEALAAYNGGTGAVADLRSGRSTPATRYSAKAMALNDLYRRELSGALDSATKRYFQPSEFACKCGCGFCKPDRRLIDTLNVIRGTLGRPVVVTSGCRCKTHNARVGGVANSNHTHGTAADVQCPDVDANEVWSTVRQLKGMGRLPQLAGLGRYDTFVHVDVEPKKAHLREWDERKKR